MSFDTLTIVGILASILSGGFLVALAARNDARMRFGETSDRSLEKVESLSR